MKLNRKYILSRGQIFVGMSIGMLLGFTPQFWAPWPKDSGIFYLQSIGFGLLLAAYTLFTGYVFQGILAKSKSITKQDIYIFWACLPFVIMAICIIWLKLVLHPNLPHRHTIQPKLEYKRHIPT